VRPIVQREPFHSGVVGFIGGEFGPFVRFLVALDALMGRAPPDLHRAVDFREDPSSRDGVGLAWAGHEGLRPIDGGLGVGGGGDAFHLMLLPALGSDPGCADDGRVVRFLVVAHVDLLAPPLIAAIRCCELLCDCN